MPVVPEVPDRLAVAPPHTLSLQAWHGAPDSQGPHGCPEKIQIFFSLRYTKAGFWVTERPLVLRDCDAAAACLAAVQHAAFNSDPSM